MSEKLILYGTEMSPPVRTVLLTLHALKLDFEFKEISPMRQEHLLPEFLSINPQHTVPTLVDNGLAIWDSHAIAAYLVRKYGKSDSLYPEDLRERAIVDQRLHYENSIIFTTLTKGIMLPIFKETATKEQLTEEIKTLLENHDLLEIFLGENRFVAGNNVTIADFSLVTSLSTLGMVVPIKASTHPKLAAWFQRMQQLPYYKAGNNAGLEEISRMLENKV